MNSNIADQIRKQRDRFMKPHLKRKGSIWTCSAQGVSGSGSTPQVAYRMWEANTRPLMTYWSPGMLPPIGDPRIKPAPSYLHPPYVVTCGGH
jgi:hypothetical protein